MEHHLHLTRCEFTKMKFKTSSELNEALQELAETKRELLDVKKKQFTSRINALEALSVAAFFKSKFLVGRRSLRLLQP